MLWPDAWMGLISAVWHFFDPSKRTVRPGATRTDRVPDVIEAVTDVPPPGEFIPQTVGHTQSAV